MAVPSQSPSPFVRDASPDALFRELLKKLDETRMRAAENKRIAQALLLQEQQNFDDEVNKTRYAMAEEREALAKERADLAAAKSQLFDV